MKGRAGGYESGKVMLRLAGRLIEEASREPLQGLNVRGFFYVGDSKFAVLGHATTDDDGSFYLESGRSESSPGGTSLTLRFEVLDGRLDLIDATEQEVELEAPDSVVDLTLAVSLPGRRDAVE